MKLEFIDFSFFIFYFKTFAMQRCYATSYSNYTVLKAFVAIKKGREVYC